jgi:hypothetical protein
VVLFVLFARILAPVLPETAVAWSFPIIFIGAIAMSFVVYRIVLKQLLKRINVEKYFDPIFGPRRPQPRKD